MTTQMRLSSCSRPAREIDAEGLGLVGLAVADEAPHPGLDGVVDLAVVEVAVEPMSATSTAEYLTRVRYGVLGFACSLSMITYLDRVCFGTRRAAHRQDVSA